MALSLNHGKRGEHASLQRELEARARADRVSRCLLLLFLCSVDEDEIIRLHNQLYNSSVETGQPGLVTVDTVEHLPKVVVSRLGSLLVRAS